MSPKAKKKRSTRKPPLNDTRKSQVETLHTHTTRRAQVFGRLPAILTAPTLLASYSVYSYFQNGAEKGSFQNNWSDAILLSMVLFSVTIAVLVIGLTVTAGFSGYPKTKEQKRIGLITVINVVTVACTTISYTFLLKGGYLDGLTTFLQSNIFPMLGRGINYVLSNIIGWAVSGIVGNFCYDLIKRKFRHL